MAARLSPLPEKSVISYMNGGVYLMKKKTLVLFLSVLACAAVALPILLRSRAKGFSSSMAVGCSAAGYSQQAGTGYLTLVLGGNEEQRTVALKVTDQKLQEKLKANDAQKIIGALIFMDVPAEVAKANGLLRDKTDAFDLLLTQNKYDEYVHVADVSYE